MIRQLQPTKLRRNETDFHDSIMLGGREGARGEVQYVHREFTGAVYLNASCKMNFQTISSGASKSHGRCTFIPTLEILRLSGRLWKRVYARVAIKISRYPRYGDTLGRVSKRILLVYSRGQIA